MKRRTRCKADDGKRRGRGRDGERRKEEKGERYIINKETKRGR